MFGNRFFTRLFCEQEATSNDFCIGARIGRLGMANFCAKFGTPVTGQFCVKCGGDTSQSTTGECS